MNWFSAATTSATSVSVGPRVMTQSPTVAGVPAGIGWALVPAALAPADDGADALRGVVLPWCANLDASPDTVTVAVTVAVIRETLICALGVVPVQAVSSTSANRPRRTRQRVMTGSYGFRAAH